MDKVQWDTVYGDLEIPESIDLALRGAPVVLVVPIPDHVLEPASLDTVPPVRITEIVGPARTREARAKVVELRIGHRDVEGFRVHRAHQLIMGKRVSSNV